MRHMNVASRAARLLVVIMGAIELTGCASFFYERTPTGKFSGKLDVEWIAPNQFIYRPNAAKPLIYTTSDGRSVQPRTMYTDGGSIPRLFWSTPQLSPWDFAPGFIIHDWLFLQHRCKEADWQSYDFDGAAAILAEAIKTQMVKAPDADPVIVWAIYQAVKTPVARRSWDSGECRLPPPEESSAPMSPSASPGFPVHAPVKIKTIEFP